MKFCSTQCPNGALKKKEAYFSILLERFFFLFADISSILSQQVWKEFGDVRPTLRARDVSLPNRSGRG